MTTIDSSEITDVTIDGTAVTEITMDGDVVWTAAPDVLMVDSFENWDANWTYEVGSSADWTTTTAEVVDGSQSLRCTATGSNARIWSSSGLDNYPAPGDTWHVYFMLGGSGISNNWYQIEYGGQDGDNHYYIMLRSDDTFRIRERTSGSDSTVASTSHTWTDNQWYHVEVEYGAAGDPNATHTATLYDYDSGDTQLEQVSGTPSGSHGQGFVGIYSISAGQESRWDHWHIDP